MSCADHALPKAGASLGSSRALLPLLCPPGLAKSATGGNKTPGRNLPSKEGILPHSSCSFLCAYPLNQYFGFLHEPLTEVRNIPGRWLGAGDAQGCFPGLGRRQLLAFWSVALLAAQPPKS